MKRRGPKKSAASQSGTINPESPQQSLIQRPSSQLSHPGLNRQLRLFTQIPQWPFELDRVEAEILEHYIQRFSRTYPTCTGPTNPFIRVFIPLSMQNRTVLDALLALSCIQSWENGGFAMEKPMLEFRHKALRGCAGMISDIISTSDVQRGLSLTASADEVLRVMAQKAASLGGEVILPLLATCALLLLYEKLSGEWQDNGTAHLQFFAHIFPARLSLAITNGLVLDQGVGNEAMQFFTSLFLYNDLVRSTSLQTSTLSNLYIDKRLSTDSGLQAQVPTEEDPGRFDFPHIIARISGGDLFVTDTEIAAWDGRLDWLPSFALQSSKVGNFHHRLPTADPMFTNSAAFKQLNCFTRPNEWSEYELIAELYRVAATIYRRQRVFQLSSIMAGSLDTDMGNLPSWAVQLVRLLPMASPYENALLWPIAIIAKELVEEEERQYMLSRLESLEQRFKMKHFHVMRSYLIGTWTAKDQGFDCCYEQPVLFG